ncbi:sensor histidine kinase [Thalassotalea ganghwensis]
MMSLRQQIQLTLNISALIVSIALLTISYSNLGASATALLFLIVAIILTSTLVAQFKLQSQQPLQVIRALANGDNTLGYSPSNLMQHYFKRINHQMQHARFNAERQNEFLNALLTHIDLGVLVCDEQGNIVESNPALAKLLGKKITLLSELKHIGELISTTSKSFRGSAQWLNGEQKDTLSVQISLAEIQGKVRKIITLQSIHEVLAHREQQAYKQLTQVLTHEVANSVTPLSSIAETCINLLPQTLCFQDDENKNDLHRALNTIRSRTDYLSEFVQGFREVSRLPQPELTTCDLKVILQQIEQLHRPQFNNQGVNLTLEVQCQQLVMVDSGQIEQVLINLLKNALEALTSASANLTQGQQAIVTITLAKNHAQQLYIDVFNNGHAIAPHIVEMIFVPFFTTKQGGSGIGLSLSKQIMVNHGGDLIHIPQSKGVCFRCIFG